MSHRVCSRCGAPLPASDALVQRCEFCGVENEWGAPQAGFAPPPPLPPPMFVPPPQPQQGAGAAIAVAVVSLIVLSMGIGFAVFATSSSSATSTVVSPPTIAIPAVPPVPTEPPPVPASKLHETPLTWTSSVKVDAPGRVGPLDKFDALANWEWAHTIGRGWYSDAKLYELRIDPIEKDGTVDLTGAPVSSIYPHAEYHFVSQDCKAAEKKRAETESNFKESSCSLEINVTAKAVEVDLDLISVDEDGRAHPITLPPCSIGDAFAYLDAHKLTVRPTYQITLVNDVFGFEYRVSAGMGSASMDGKDVSPTFCGKKATPATTAKPTATTTASATPSATADAVPFDRAAAYTALKGAGVSECKTQNGITGSIRATVVFQPAGNVSAVTITDANAGTPAGDCASKKLRAAKVPPFSGSAVTVSAPL